MDCICKNLQMKTKTLIMLLISNVTKKSFWGLVVAYIGLQSISCPSHPPQPKVLYTTTFWNLVHSTCTCNCVQFKLYIPRYICIFVYMYFWYDYIYMLLLVFTYCKMLPCQIKCTKLVIKLFFLLQCFASILCIWPTLINFRLMKSAMLNVS